MQRTEIDGESTSMVLPTLRSRTAREQNRYVLGLKMMSCGLGDIWSRIIQPDTVLIQLLQLVATRFDATDGRCAGEMVTGVKAHDMCVCGADCLALIDSSDCASSVKVCDMLTCDHRLHHRMEPMGRGDKGPDLQNISRQSYDNAKVTIDIPVRRTSNL